MSFWHCSGWIFYNSSWKNRVHLNWLVSLHGRDLNIVNLIEVGALGKPFKKLNICLLHLHVSKNTSCHCTHCLIWPWILSTWAAANFRQTCRCLFWSRSFFHVMVCHGLKLQRCKTCFTVDGYAGVPAVYSSQRRLEPSWTIETHKYLSPISSHLSVTVLGVLPDLGEVVTNRNILYLYRVVWSDDFRTCHCLQIAPRVLPKLCKSTVLHYRSWLLINPNECCQTNPF